MKMKNGFLAASTGLILLLLVACGAPKPKPRPTLLPPTPTQLPPTQTAEVLPDTSIRYHFITNKLLIPTTDAQSQAFALNVDGDPQQHPDNLFGELLTMLTSAAPGLELQSNIDQTINAGQMVTLHAMQADDPLNDPSVSWSIFQGQKTQSAPSFDGSDRFALDLAAPTNWLIDGSLTNGHFAGGPGTARVQMVLLGTPVDVDLIGVRLEADVSAKGCANGKLGGGMTVDEFRSKLLPALADGLNRIIKTDKAVANTLLQAFDADQSGAISSAELENNLLLKLVISPDLDLLDASGKFNPRQDGVKDSLSLGLGFTCVPASFTAPTD